jgi:hypothetical protein
MDDRSLDQIKNLQNIEKMVHNLQRNVNIRKVIKWLHCHDNDVSKYRIRAKNYRRSNIKAKHLVIMVTAIYIMIKVINYFSIN